ncbi:PD-(D/E)XK nuclease family protein [uncultured Treponema sp.]|uniref:PD-(D/E)XK nuclease family protein n=1 Tax=uncultured Treponema sp. TaxID=162155 RepID=UPI0025CBD5D8|nr:PD-(D/E)XK nuclease family protein [uncultured Treponema sp.]
METVQKILKEQIRNQDAVFVFPTDIACQKWADWAIKNTGVKAVAMERFIAWDNFKGECIRAELSDLKTVPSIMRKIFASCLIESNAAKPFFKSLIIEKFAGEAASFSDWLSSILPSLKMWKNLRDRQKDCLDSARNEGFLSFDGDISLQKFYEDYRKNAFTDAEDRDYEILYEKYSKFLEENHLFDPAWVEPDFSGDGREYFLIYPETLEDWEQYRHKLSEIEKIHFVSVPENEGEYDSYLFDNSSVELKDVALFLRQMHDEDKIEWSDMAVNVPNLDNFGSYIDRELALYEIPHSIRYSRPLSSYGAGAVFSQIQDCVENQFSYESLKNLLLNEDLPWNNKATIENLLLFGRMNNCICTAGEVSYEKGKILTVWDEAFKNPKNDGGTGLNADELIRNLYRNLIDLLPPMVNARTFAEIRAAYEDFRENFFDMAEFQNMILSNNVLSRCISSLNELVDLEADYPNYKVASPFAFFVSHLTRVQYLSQGESRAVQVYPYRTAAAAPYKIHVVLDSTQDSLSLADSFKPLDFVNENKRRIFMKLGEIDLSLGFADSDPSFDFVKMYQHSAIEKAYFTASKHAYNGEYGFAYGKMGKMTENPLAREDVYSKERKFLLSLGDSFDSSSKKAPSLPKIYAKQAGGFAKWKNSHLSEKSDCSLFEKDEKFTQLIRERLRYLKENREGHRAKNPLLLGKIEVTQTTLKNYFKCPRRWLFKNVLKLNPPDNEAELIDEFILGTVNHKVFELFFTEIMKKKAKLCPASENSEKLGEDFKKILIKSINDAVSEKSRNSAFKEIFADSYESRTASQTTIKVISSQYKISEDSQAEENANFRMLEKSLAKFCETFRGHTVYAVEKEVQALPHDENGAVQEGYYFSGKIDCILASPNEREFTVVDFKTSSNPSNLFIKEKKEGKPEPVIDFQMPIYVYLLENALEESERLKIDRAMFYSIKACEEKFYLGNSPISERPSIRTTPENAKLVESEFLTFAKRFYDEVTDENFAVKEQNQSRIVCTKKDGFDNCIDYQAVCRRYFVVSGEKI